MQNDYLESMTQDFNAESTAIQFASMIQKYFPSEQVEIHGCKVTCRATKKAESWFLVLFTMQVMMQRRRFPVPKEVMMCMVNLSQDFNNEENANLVEELFSQVGLDQKKIMEELSKL